MTKRKMISAAVLTAAVLFSGCRSTSDVRENGGKTGGRMQSVGIQSGRMKSTEAEWADVHGAGSQRSDPKAGDISEYADGHGPQGDAVRIYNMARAVRQVSLAELSYSVVDTNQKVCFDNKAVLRERDSGRFNGQDADYTGLDPSYTDNIDGTVTDNNTGLMWQKNPGEKMSWDEAFKTLEKANSSGFLGYSDWRIPSIKELYSLIEFSGRDVSPQSEKGAVPFIDTDYFDFSYGNINRGERIIDSQYMSSTRYVSKTMKGDDTVFGVNFADGRIKGYGMKMGSRDKEFYVIFVRGNNEYGKNNFADNKDGTVTDLATGLMWMKYDSAKSMVWEEALEWAENLEFASYSDWRLPDVKELQSIVDYSRSPETSGSAAIDPVFRTTVIKNEKGEDDYGFYWSSTTHAVSVPGKEGGSAAYVAFGTSPGNMDALQNIPHQGQSGGMSRPSPGGRSGIMPPPPM